MSLLLSTVGSSASSNGLVHLTTTTDSAERLKTYDNLGGTLFNASFKNTIKVTNTWEFTLGSDSITFPIRYLSGSNLPTRFTKCNIGHDPFVNNRAYMGVIFSPIASIYNFHTLFERVLLYSEYGNPNAGLGYTGSTVGFAKLGVSNQIYIGFNTNDSVGSILHNNRNGAKVILLELDYSFSGDSVIFNHDAKPPNDIKITKNTFDVNAINITNQKFLQVFRASAGDETVSAGNARNLAISPSYVSSSGSGSSHYPDELYKGGFNIFGETFPSSQFFDDGYKLSIKNKRIEFIANSGIGRAYLGRADPSSSYGNSLCAHYKEHYVLGNGDSFTIPYGEEDFSSYVITTWRTDTNRHIGTRVFTNQSIPFGDSNYVLHSYYFSHGAMYSNIMRLYITNSGRTFTYRQTAPSEPTKIVVFRY